MHVIKNEIQTCSFCQCIIDFIVFHFVSGVEFIVVHFVQNINNFSVVCFVQVVPQLFILFVCLFSAISCIYIYLSYMF
jgi:hypothetical protein